MRTKEEIQQELKALSDKVTELQQELQQAPETTRLEKLGFYEPKDGDNYSNIGHQGYIGIGTWRNDLLDNYYSNNGNVFKTEEDAEVAIKRLEIMADLWRNSTTASDGVYIVYNEYRKTIEWCWQGEYNYLAPKLTEAKAQEMLNKWGDDLKLLLI